MNNILYYLFTQNNEIFVQYIEIVSFLEIINSLEFEFFADFIYGSEKLIV